MAEGFGGPSKAFAVVTLYRGAPDGSEEGAVSLACSLFICAWCQGRMGEPWAGLPLLQPAAIAELSRAGRHPIDALEGRLKTGPGDCRAWKGEVQGPCRG